MTQHCTVIEDDERNIREAEQSWDYALTFNTGSNNKKLFQVFSSLLDEFDCDIGEIYNAQHINSATGYDLNKYGQLVNVNRKSEEINSDEYIYGFPFGDTLESDETFTVKSTEKYFIQQDTTINGLLEVNGEVLSQESFDGSGVISGSGSVVGDDDTVFSEDKFRSRIKAAFRASTIGTTFDQFVEFTASILTTDFDNIDFLTSYDATPATVIVRANEAVFNSVGFSASDVDNLLNEGVPAGHSVNVEVSGTFELKSDGQTDDADNGLTADGIQTGGTLTEDLT